MTPAWERRVAVVDLIDEALASGVAEAAIDEALARFRAEAEEVGALR